MYICLPSQTSVRHMKSLSTDRHFHSTKMVQKFLFLVEISHKIPETEYIQAWRIICSSVDYTDDNDGLECKNYNFLQLYNFHFIYFGLCLLHLRVTKSVKTNQPNKQNSNNNNNKNPWVDFPLLKFFDKTEYWIKCHSVPEDCKRSSLNIATFKCLYNT